MAAVLRGAGLLLGALATILVARALQPDRFGDYAFVLSLVTIVSVPPTIGLRQTLARETAYATARNETTRLAAIWQWAFGWSAVIAILLAAALALWALRAPAPDGMRGPLLAGALALLLMPAPQIFAGVLQGLGRIKSSLVPEAIVRPVLLLILIALLRLVAPDDWTTVTVMLLAVVVAVAAEAGVSAALFLRATGFRPGQPHSSTVDLPRAALGLSVLSFGAIASVHLINTNLDVVMLGLLADDTAAGLYRGATVLSELVAFGLGVVNFVILPRVAGFHAQGDRDGLQRLVTLSARVITGMAVIGFVVILLAGRLLLSGLFGAEFSGGQSALVILAFGQLVNAIFGPVALVLNMTGHERLTLLGVSVAVVLNTGLNLALIPQFGIEGAAIASASALAVWNVLLAVLLWRRLGYSSTVFGGQVRSPKRP